MTHWSTRSLARIAMARGLVPHITHSTISLILRYADLRPHRSRYWKTPTLDEDFRRRAARVLWCYENAWKLAAQGELVVCIDEMPNLQALERRCPSHPMRPGHIEHREFEYIRHGTVNFMVALLVPSGRMHGWCLDANDSDHLRPALRHFFHAHRNVRRIHLIWDGGSSHVGVDTQVFLHDYPHVRVLRTPSHASWLNQAELLLRAFRERYLKRGDWSSRQHLIEHLGRSWPEYNRLFAHPFMWSWTRAKMDEWLARHGQ
jgi:transposase